MASASHLDATEKIRSNAELLAGPNRSERYLGPICNQNLLEERRGQCVHDPCYNGRLSCFFAGRASRLVEIASSALINRDRVSDGSITSSM